MTIQNYIDNYIQSKGSAFDNDKDSILNEMLTSDEKRIYEYIKESDKQRLIKFS